MILVERHLYKQSHRYYKEMDNICFLSKNLYNATLYAIRQHYFTDKKYIGYTKINKLFQQSKNADYYALPTKVSQQTQRLVDKSFKSFFNHLKTKRANEVVHLPKYLHKSKGRQVAFYTSQAISRYKDKYIKLSKTNIIIKTKIKFDNISFVRLVPNKSNKTITAEIGYECNKERNEQYTISNSNIASIDLGINNLATITFTNHIPIIINGKPIKSINQYYNKQKSKFQSIAKVSNKIMYTNRLIRLSIKRNNKINDYLHKSTHYIVNQLVSNHISTVVVGYNKGWKQDTNMSKINNQKFVCIPFLKLIQMLSYKCKLKGIDVYLQEESYTSKASFLDKDDIPIYENHNSKCDFSGKRIKRGLYKSAQNQILNADVNGSYNIMRKYLNVVKNTNIYNLVNLIEACSTPSVFTVNT